MVVFNLGGMCRRPPLEGAPLLCSGVLELFDEGAVLVLRLGHECEQRASAQARLKAMSLALGTATFRLQNVNQPMAGGQFVSIPPRSQGRGDVLVPEKQVDGPQIDFAVPVRQGLKCLNFGGESQTVGQASVEQRLDAEMIPCQQYFSAP